MPFSTEPLRKHALTLPEAEESTSCNKAAFKAGKKNFFFLGESDDEWNGMVKLADSLPQAEQLATKSPDNCSVGKSGWVTVDYPMGKGPRKGVMEKWITESYRLLVPKKLSAQLD